MKKRTGLGLLGLALAGGTAAGMSALRRQLHQRAMTAIPRNPRYDEVEPRIHREGREWARRGGGFRTMTIRSTDELEDFCRKEQPEMAVLCIPKEAAPQLVEVLVGCGVKGFWNFSHYDILHDYPDVIVENVHMGDSLMTLSYHMVQEEN